MTENFEGFEPAHTMQYMKHPSWNGTKVRVYQANLLYINCVGIQDFALGVIRESKIKSIFKILFMY